MVVARTEALHRTRPAAKAFLETSDVSDLPGARRFENLFVIDSKLGRGPGEYQASTVPVFQDGVFQGARFAEVVPGSVYAHLGIRADDLIRRIDGEQVETPQKALEIYSKLLQQRRVEVEVERQGRPSLEVYEID